LTIAFTVGGCAFTDDAANGFIFSEKYGCSREKKRGKPALVLDEVMFLLRLFVAEDA